MNLGFELLELILGHLTRRIVKVQLELAGVAVVGSVTFTFGYRVRALLVQVLVITVLISDLLHFG